MGEETPFSIVLTGRLLMDALDLRMMLNTSQNLDDWQKYFGHPDGSKLGLMNAIYQIGSLASFPFV